MLVTAFLSMWINNSASANIMIPTAIAIVDELKSQQQQIKKDDHEVDHENSSSTTENGKHRSAHLFRSFFMFFTFAQRNQTLYRAMISETLSLRQCELSSFFVKKLFHLNVSLGESQQ